jgi:hypothetical protein
MQNDEEYGVPGFIKVILILSAFGLLFFLMWVMGLT